MNAAGLEQIGVEGGVALIRELMLCIEQATPKYPELEEDDAVGRDDQGPGEQEGSHPGEYRDKQVKPKDEAVAGTEVLHDGGPLRGV
jgi:hypothetical protein